MSLEAGIVAVIVLAFGLRALHQLFPATSRRLVAGLRRRLGLKTATPSASAAGCGSGCGSCGACDSPAPRGDEQPLQFRAPPRR